MAAATGRWALDCQQQMSGQQMPEDPQETKENNVRQALSATFLSLFISLLIAGQCLAADKVFLMTPSNPAQAYPRFHIGVTGIYATIEKGLLVTVDSTEPNTPAAGKFQKGDVLVKVNGRPVSDPEPYIALGEALTAAEAGDGKLVFAVKRGDKEEPVAITIPVLGAYSKTWPLDCKKSDTIIRQAAEFLAQPENLKNPGFFGGLLLLSTGDDRYLPAVKAMVDRNSPDKAGSHTWNNGYAGILIAEYYLRTGDKGALPRLKSICVDAKERQSWGGWCHWDGPVPGYVQGGLMNPAGVQVLSTLILAKECGVEVDQGTFDRALTFFYRFAGHEAVPYGDHRTEGWLSGNGKNGMLAGALSLLDGKAYQMAAQTMSLDMADSYRWLGAGHASSFGDHIWRGLGSVHVPQDKQDHYRLSMDKLTWYYDLSRRPNGGFGLLNLGAGVGDDVGWGHGLALAYTAPRKTLRITGVPHTKYSQKVQAPELPWGRPRDLEFLRTDYCEGFGKEEMEPHEIYDKLGDAYNSPKEKVNKAFCVKMMRHYNPTARRQAGAALARLGATDEIAQALQDQDARVRRAGLEAVTGYRCWWGGGTASVPPAVVSQKYLPSILKILKDQDSSFWEIDGALLALGMAELDDVTANLDLIRKYVGHEEWWLREAAWRALEPLSKDEKRIEPELPALFKCMANETHVMPRRVFMGFMQRILNDGKMSSGIKKKVAAGMMQAIRDTVIEPGYLGAIGRNNKYETLRYFLAQTPEAAPQVLDEFEQYMSRLDFFGGWGWPEAWFIGDVWGNPGIIKCAEKLGKAEGASLLARCKRVVARLEEQKKQSQGKDVKAVEEARDKMIAAVTKAIQECEKRMGGE